MHIFIQNWLLVRLCKKLDSKIASLVQLARFLHRLRTYALTEESNRRGREKTEE